MFSYCKSVTHLRFSVRWDRLFYHKLLCCFRLGLTLHGVGGHGHSHGLGGHGHSHGGHGHSHGNTQAQQRLLSGREDAEQGAHHTYGATDIQNGENRTYALHKSFLHKVHVYIINNCMKSRIIINAG